MSKKVFYLGRNRREKSEYIYEADHLTTHAVVFGMTGSGKTGLCIDLLEEAALSDIPVVIIDPKGDVANLALLFPELSGSEFRPWVNRAQAAGREMSLDDYADKTALKWKQGLQDWDIAPERIRELKEKMDLRIFTPGSSAGLQVNIVDIFQLPDNDIQSDAEAMTDRISNGVSAVLSLLGIDSDPLKSKPHILISNIVQHYWNLKRGIDIEELILNIQKPPFRKLGVFDVNQIIDESERIELAFQLNNVIAAPGFQYWSNGSPLNGGDLYASAENRVPVSIFSIAHLSEQERMFFVSLLLNELVYWVRSQPGSPNLKYLLYMDEVFGYLPPYPLNPPSKKPLMTLLKQARAFGFGTVLVTQNPKDIDYKGLTNMGTWFVGKLQADGDRERVLEGMTGIADASGAAVPVRELSAAMSSLKKREFMVKNIHNPGIDVFTTRWAMSYLAGPLTREQIKTLMKPLKSAAPAAEDVSGMETEAGRDLLPAPPPIGIALTVRFEKADSGEPVVYTPAFYFRGEVVFDDSRAGVYVRRNVQALAHLQSNAVWQILPDTHPEISCAGEPALNVSGYAAFPFQPDYKMLRRYQTDLKNMIFSDLTLELMVNPELNLTAEEGESEDAFRQRCRDVVEKMADKKTGQLSQQYERKLRRLEDRVEREKLKIEQLTDQHKAKKMEEYISIGESVLGVLLGSKSRRGFSTAARRRRMTAAAKTKIELGKTKVDQLEEEVLSLKEELEDRIAEIEDQLLDRADNIEKKTIRLEKNDILLSRQMLLWKIR